MIPPNFYNLYSIQREIARTSNHKSIFCYSCAPLSTSAGLSSNCSALVINPLPDDKF